MSDSSPPSAPGPAPKSSAPDPEATELQTMLFLDMVAQQTNLALIFLGEVPHPETGKRVRELRTARIFIDQLEMLEAKTRGNLNKREEALLKQSLMATRMAFVNAAGQESHSPPPTAPSTPSTGSGQVPSTSSGQAPSTSSGEAASKGAGQDPSTPHATSSANAPAPDAPAATATPAAAQDEERKKFVKKY